MGIADPEAARAKVSQFIHYITEYNSSNRSLMERLWDSDNPMMERLEQRRRSAEKEINLLQPLIERIAQQIDPDEDSKRFKKRRSSSGSWNTARGAAERLLGILGNEQTYDLILGPEGPALSAPLLHPWVWHAAVDLWGNRHYEDAVFRAAAAIERQLQLKLDRGDLSGTALYTEAFNTRSGQRLRFGHIRKETDDGKLKKDWTSSHQGAMHFGMGCALGIRNPLAHGARDLDEHEALEYLAALSVLARWIDTAQVRLDKSDE